MKPSSTPRLHPGDGVMTVTSRHEDDATPLRAQSISEMLRERRRDEARQGPLDRAAIVRVGGR
jgi:hypothetical protein